MKYIILLIFIYSFNSSADTTECFNLSEIEIIDSMFKANNEHALSDLAINPTKNDLLQDSFLNNTKNVLTKINEISYEWGHRQDSDIPLESSGKFPEKSTCVWSVSFSLPEKIRNQCDDLGMYGYYFSFKKKHGNIILYKFTSLVDALPDNSLACKAANMYFLNNRS